MKDFIYTPEWQAMFGTGLIRPLKNTSRGPEGETVVSPITPITNNSQGHQPFSIHEYHDRRRLL